MYYCAGVWIYNFFMIMILPFISHHNFIDEFFERNGPFLAIEKLNPYFLFAR